MPSSALVARPKAPQHAARLSLQQALVDFRTILTPAEQAKLTTTIQSTAAPSAASVLELALEIDGANAERPTRRLGVRLQPFLDGIQQFTAIVDAFIGLGPSIAETIWGIVKMTLLLAGNAASYFEKLTNLLRAVGDNCPRYRDYASLYHSSQRLQDALCRYFEKMIRLCRQAVKISRTPTALRLVRTALWPFDADFGPIQESLQQASQEVKAEVQVAAAKLQVEEAELQKAERLEASKSRNLLATFSSSARQAFAELQRRWDEYDARQKRRTILQLTSCLFQVDYVRAWRLVHKQAMTGTAEWFKHDNSFLSWCSTTSSTLLRVQGSLGCGKSILVANIVAHLQMTSQTGSKVVHFFCRDATIPSLSAQTIIRSICGQLIQDSLEHQTQGALDQLIITANKAEYHEVLQATIKYTPSYDSIYLVIDNLDYCTDDEFDQVLEAVRELGDHLACSVKMLIAMRSDTRGKVLGLFPAGIVMNMQKTAIDSDLNSYVENTLLQNLECSKMHFDDPSLAGQVCDYIVEGADGMFLWASLVLEEICIQTTDQAIIGILQTSPPTLRRLFEQTLLRVHTSHRYPYIGNMLMWTLGVECELTLAELCQALSVKPGQDRPTPSKSAIDVTSAIASMRGLVCLDEDDATIRLVHHSFRKYLLDTSRADELTEFKFDITEVQIELAHLCMTFLDSNIFTSSMAKQTPHGEEALVVSQLVGASNNALQNESRTALSVLKARKHLRQISIRSQSPSDETVLHDIEYRLAERIARMAESAKKDLSRQTDYPFLDYARRFWYKHAFSLTPETNDPAWVLFRRLFRSKRPHYEQPWYEKDSGSLGAPTPGFERLDPATLHSIRWSQFESHAAVMAAVLEDQFFRFVEHMTGDLEKVNLMDMFILLGQSLLSAPSQRMARAICFRLSHDNLGKFWTERTLQNVLVVSREVRQFLAVRFDLPEYIMFDDRVEFDFIKTWYNRDMGFLDGNAADRILATNETDTLFSPLSTASLDDRGMRPVILEIVQKAHNNNSSLSLKSTVLKDVRDRLRLDNYTFSFTLLELSVIFGSRNILAKISQDPQMNVGDLIATALFEGAFDVIERYILDRPEAMISTSIDPSLPIVALWLDREDIAEGISRLALNFRSSDSYQIFPDALRCAFQYAAPMVFNNLLNAVQGLPFSPWHLRDMSEDLDALRMYINQATADNPSPACKAMKAAYDNFCTAAR